MRIFTLRKQLRFVLLFVQLEFVRECRATSEKVLLKVKAVDGGFRKFLMGLIGFLGF